MGYFVSLVIVVVVLGQGSLVCAQNFLGNCVVTAVFGDSCVNGEGVLGQCVIPATPTTAPLICLALPPCPDDATLPYIVHGYYHKIDTTTAELYCFPGYVTTAAVYITYDVVTGNWSEPAEICEPVDCTGTEQNVPNGQWEAQNTGTLGDLSFLLCDEGYEISGGPYAAVCEAYGQWSFSNATCIPEVVRVTG